MFHLCSWNLWSLLLQNVWLSAAQNNHYTEKIRKVCGILICVPCLILCQERSSLLRTGFEQRRRRRWRKAPGFIIFIIRHNFTLLNWKPVPSRPVSGLNFNLVTTANTVYGNLCFWQEFYFLLGLSGGRMVKKHGKNYEYCPVSNFIARSLWNGRSPSLSFIRGRSVDFYTPFVEPDRQIVLIIMTISVEIAYKKNKVTMDSKLLYHKISNQYSRSF